MYIQHNSSLSFVQKNLSRWSAYTLVTYITTLSIINWHTPNLSSKDLATEMNRYETKYESSPSSLIDGSHHDELVIKAHSVILTVSQNLT